MIPSDIFLAIGPILIGDIFTLISAADFPFSALDCVNQLPIMNVEVCQDVICPLAGAAPDVLCMTHLIKAHIVRANNSRRVVIGHRLTLKAGQRGLRKNFFWAAVDCQHLPGLCPIQADLAPQIILVTGSGNRDIAADQKSVVRLNLVWAYGVAVILDHQSTSPVCSATVPGSPVVYRTSMSWIFTA